MQPVTTQQVNLFEDPLEHRILPNAGWPFFTINYRADSGRLHQRPYRVMQLIAVLTDVAAGRLYGGRDVYMSQAFFAKPQRRVLHLLLATHALVDLDTYTAPALRGLTLDQIAGLVRIYCRDEGIPQPTAIIFSGRGLYLKWHWRHPIPRAAAGRAVAVNRALVARFATFGGDPSAVDMARILRMISTINTKSGARVRILDLAEVDGEPLRYDFDTFADEVLPYTLEQVRQFKQGSAERTAKVHRLTVERVRRRAEVAHHIGQRAFCREDFYWKQIEDFRTLAVMRFGPEGRVRYSDQQPPAPGGGKRPGADMFALLGACALAQLIPATPLPGSGGRSQLALEIDTWARGILPVDYAAGEDMPRHLSTLFDRAKRAAAGENSQWLGHQVSPIYAYRTETICDLLQIEPDEERHLRVLISRDEKRRRDREATMAARRAEGVQERSAYEAQAAERSTRARALRDAGLSWAEVARRMEQPTAEAARQLAFRGRRWDRAYRCVPTSTTA